VTAPSGEVLVFTDAGGLVRLHKGSVWRTQAQMSKLYRTTPQNITQHVRGSYEDGEQDPDSTCKPSLQVQREGSVGAELEAAIRETKAIDQARPRRKRPEEQ
jgi:hypothetical protein